MKKRSATKPSLSPPRFTFFTDRDLGKSIPRLLRENGLDVERYFDHFTDADLVPDEVWLRYVFERRWVALSHDNNIRTDPRSLKEILQNAGRLLILRGKQSHLDLGRTFLEALPLVDRLLRNSEGPFIANVRRSAQKGGGSKAVLEVMFKPKG